MYSADLRRAALHLYSVVHSIRKTSGLLKVGRSTIARWVKAGGVRKPYPQRASKSDVLVGYIRGILAAHPFTTSQQLSSMILTNLGISVSKELVRVVIRKAGFTQKNAKFFGRPSGIEGKTVDFVQARDVLLAAGGYCFASIDETSFGHHGPAIRGWAPRGQALFATRTPARITTTSVLTVCLQDGRLMSSQRTGSFNTASFLEALKSFGLPSGTVLLLDNVRFHHARVVKEYAASHGLRLLYVPPYSPWFNPVEGVFSIAKRHYYKNASIEGAMQAVTPNHIQSFFRHSLNLRSPPSFAT